MANRYTIDGKEYESQQAVADAYKISARLLGLRLAKGMSIDEAAKTPVKKRGQTRSKPIEIEGIEYASFKEACEQNKTNRTTAISRINAGYSEKEAITFSSDQLPKKNRFEFEYENVTYQSQKECMRKLGLEPECVSKYATRHKIDIKDAIRYYLEKNRSKSQNS